MAASYSIVCQTCGKEFTIEKRRLETAKCCSIPCERARRKLLPRKPLEERFWGKVKIAGAEECWVWTGSLNPNGYGSFNLDGKTSSAHRIAYTLASGRNPGLMHVRHTCDNPPCVNPAHLELGTHADNMRDMSERGRAAVPEEQKRALSIARTGKRLSLEHRAKMSAAAKGRKPHNMKPVRVGGAEYPSVAHAVKALGRSKKWFYSQIEKGGAEYVERK